MQHLDPGLGLRHRARGHGGLLGGNRIPGAQRRGVAVTTRPVRAAQARIGESGKGTEQDQIEGQEQREQAQRLDPLQRGMVAIAPIDPGHRPQRQQRAHQQQAGQRRQVVERLSIHGVMRRVSCLSAQASPR